MRCILRCLARGLGEVVLRHLQIVLLGNALGVPNPGADNVNEEHLGQFRFPARTLGPALTFTAEQIDELLSILDQSIGEVLATV